MPERHTGVKPLEREASLSRLIAAHRHELLDFARRRLPDHATAEDVVSETLARTFMHLDELREESAILAWLYRSLRNAVVDHHRRAGTASRALERWAAEMQTEVDAAAPPRQVCGCVAKIAASLKPEHARALARVEVDGEAVRAFATEVGISSSNAAVRLFRAREALRRGVLATCGACAEGGCVDCTCSA